MPWTGRAVRRQPVQCRASSAPARSAASATSATSDTSNARSGANCFSGPRKSAKLMLAISPEELQNTTTAPFASAAPPRVPAVPLPR